MPASNRDFLLSWEEARAAVISAVRPTVEELVDLGGADRRVLARDVVNGEPLPPFDNSAMDGFAVRAADLAGGVRRLPLSPPVRAGDGPGVLPAGHAMSIATGAPIPVGADCVVPLEDADAGDADVLLPGGVPEGRYVRTAGSDVPAGETVLRAGTVLGPGEGGLLAALGHDTVHVHRRPVVAILATGNELVPVAQRPPPGSIRESNSTAVAWACRRYGADVRLLGIARDTPEALRTAIETGLDADLLITSGGVSVGERDLVRRTLAELGAVEHFWGVALRPGKPCAFATLGDTAILGLPGNPASTLVGLALFAAPAIRAMNGDPDPLSDEEPGIADGVWGDPTSRDEAVRCRVARGPAGPVATPTGDQSSHRMASLVGVDALALVPAGTRVSPGDAVRLIRSPWGARA